MNNQPPDIDPADELDDEAEFQPCEKCDGHPACEDHGCAYALGLGKMVKKDRTQDWEQ